MMEEYILIIDDDSDIRNLIGIYLDNEGYRYIKCDNAVTALDILQNTNVMLVLLDVMLPKLDGINACIEFRKLTNAPIIFISAKADEVDVINGLMSGGDDYVTKPFNPVQLMTRIKAQIRRFKQYNSPNEKPYMLEYEDLTLNTETHRVWVNGTEIPLTFKEYEILELLLRNRNCILSMKQIYEAVWCEEFIGAENTIMMHIANLRKKLDYDKTERNYIKTVWGRGYKV
jgi:DNA-binding response OmpR family regulator